RRLPPWRSPLRRRLRSRGGGGLRQTTCACRWFRPRLRVRDERLRPLGDVVRGAERVGYARLVLDVDEALQGCHACVPRVSSQEPRTSATKVRSGAARTGRAIAVARVQRVCGSSDL